MSKSVCKPRSLQDTISAVTLSDISLAIEIILALPLGLSLISLVMELIVYACVRKRSRNYGVTE